VNRPMIGAIFMAVLLVIYLAFTVNYAWILIRDDLVLVQAMGVALMVLPFVGAWALFAEMRFAIHSRRLMMRLEADGLMPVDELPSTIAGRPNRVVADEAFPAFAAAVEAEPKSWQAWLRLGLAYDASGDRRRARWAVRRAIKVERGA